VLGSAATDVREEAESMYEWWTVKMKKPDYGLTKDTFIACDILKRLWRRNHPKIVARWGLLEDAFGRAAVDKMTTDREVHVTAKNSWVRVHLPSGRMLSYPNARYGKVRKVDETEDDDETLLFDGMGINKQWGAVFTHGGKLFENETQAIAADVLCHTRVRCEEGFNLPVVFDVHDELVVETADKTPEDLRKVMTMGFYWSKGLPLAAKVEEMMRYRK
jgi:DNA polymerase bacteriophage-type